MIWLWLRAYSFKYTAAVVVCTVWAILVGRAVGA
jgi:hypothetical protein